MSGLTTKNNALYLDGVLLSDIAKDVGTPTYVYSAAAIRAQYEALSGAMKRALPADRQPLICYAGKANGHLAILSLLRSLGSSIETVSEGELLRALQAGFDPSKIVAEGVGKTRTEITAGLKAGVHQFNIESLSELTRINEIAASLGKVAHIVFRLNPDIGGGGNDKITTGRKSDKFGMLLPRVIEGYELARTLKNVKCVGLHTHIGSQISSAEFFESLFQKIVTVVKDLRQAGHEVSRLDIGGGFPIVYKDETLLDLDTYANLVRDYIEPLGTQIILEPGRYMVGNAGFILTEVLYVKQAEDRTFLILDAGMNDLVRPAMYSAYHDIQPVAHLERAAKTYDIAGPVCESSDIFGRERVLPAMEEGDIAVIKSAGAYGFCMASNYNTRRLPAEVLVHDGKYSIIRQRQSYEDILGGEIVPDWIK